MKPINWIKQNKWKPVSGIWGPQELIELNELNELNGAFI